MALFTNDKMTDVEVEYNYDIITSVSYEIHLLW